MNKDDNTKNYLFELIHNNDKATKENLFTSIFGLIKNQYRLRYMKYQ